jgi:hypothetical protein
MVCKGTVRVLMNRGTFSANKGKGQNIGLNHIWLGSNVIGYNTESLASGAGKQYGKKITPPKSGILASIDIYCANTVDSVQALFGAIANNDGANGGYQFPGRMLTVRGGETSSGFLCANANLNTTPRWVSIPMGAWLEAGQTYWLIARAARSFTAYYTDDTCSDCDYAQNGTWLIDFNSVWAVSNKRWSIRGSFVY